MAYAPTSSALLAVTFFCFDMARLSMMRNLAHNAAYETVRFAMMEGVTQAEAQQVAEIARLIKAADQEARTLARGLVPIEFQPEGLSHAITRLATNTERLFNIRCTIEQTGNPFELPDSDAATHLYRIVQEAMNNAARHGKPHL